MNKFFNWLFKQGNNNSGHNLSPSKKKQFQEMKIIWEESAKIPMPEAPDSQQEWTKLQRAIRIAENRAEKKSLNPFLSFMRKPQFAAAFSFVLVAIVVSAIFFYQKTGTIIYETANKEKASVVLADGSTVQLNSGSKLSVPKDFNDNSRSIRLEGEAYFQVQKSNVPFQVKTEIGKATVLGTKFNINSRNDRMDVAVNQGRVQVTTTVSQKDSSVLLTSGEMCTCKFGKYPNAPEPIKFEEYPGWLYGKMTLEKTELSFVLEEIERRFDVKIQQKDKNLDTLKISGLFDASDLGSLMSSLCILIQKEYSDQDNIITIY